MESEEYIRIYNNGSKDGRQALVKEVKEIIGEMIDSNKRTDTLIYGNELLKKLEKQV